MKMSLFLKISLFIWSVLVQESTGLRSPFLSVSDSLRPIAVQTPERLYEGKWRFILLQSASYPKRAHKHHHLREKVGSIPQGPAISPAPSPFPSSGGQISSRKLPFPAIPPNHQVNTLTVPSPSPAISPTSSSMEASDKSLPPPPLNQRCTSVICAEPLTYTPPGGPCGCVWPIEIRLCFGLSLYTFLPLVSDLSEEIAAAIPLEPSQVRIVGADAADQQLEKTAVLVKLVPLEQNFKAETALDIFTKFWKRDISIKKSVFGVYEVIYVRYPGLPPSPPSRSLGSVTIDSQPFPSTRNDDGPIKPFGVDVRTHRKNESTKSIVVIIILSTVTAFVLFMGCILLLLSKWGYCGCLRRRTQPGLIPSVEKPSGVGQLLTLKSGISSASMSISSSLVARTGTAKVFSIDEIEMITDNFNTSRILGEGGFGLVYGGILDDGRKVAVKVLKRDDQQGSREFLAEVEMLSRLHHRNLVKLLGICPEDQCRCLVYELVPNGSVESHLHGVDKGTDPLDWGARMKIALGAARGLAYLHEDSSPRVIHRDFKSSNILLEHDYTPKVSDFGLARTALDEGSKQISTHVMGTFGYLAPEYAMTGHLLVKSDVYSYGVVLLELLTGRKPVDLSQPPGQENLVAWARPLLSLKNSLETIVDPSLSSSVPLDLVSKVAAIASMCVQPEVSHRPFMGEVVQALKLVCNDFEETREQMSRSCSQELSIGTERKNSRLSNELLEALDDCGSPSNAKIALSAVDLKSVSAGFEGQESESFRRQFNSAPLSMGKKRKFWHRLKGLSRGSMSEHEYGAILRQSNSRICSSYYASDMFETVRNYLDEKTMCMAS